MRLSRILPTSIMMIAFGAVIFTFAGCNASLEADPQVITFIQSEKEENILEKESNQSSTSSAKTATEPSTETPASTDSTDTERPIEEPADIIEEPIPEPEEPVAEEPIAEEPIVESPTEPAIEEPVIEEPTEPIAEPIVEEPVIEGPTEPVVEKPVENLPTFKFSIIDTRDCVVYDFENKNITINYNENNYLVFGFDFVKDDKTVSNKSFTYTFSDSSFVTECDAVIYSGMYFEVMKTGTFTLTITETISNTEITLTIQVV